MPRRAAKLRFASSLGRRLTARTTSRRSQARSRRQRADLLGAPAPSSTRASGRADRRRGNRDADQAGELGAEARQVRLCAREGDLADTWDPGWVLVETGARRRAPRANVCSCRREPPARSRAAPRLKPSGTCSAPPENEIARFSGSTRSAPCRARGNRDAERPAAPLEHARELADAPVGDGERGAVVADRDRDERAALDVGTGVDRRRDRAQQREGLEIDADDLQAGLAQA